MIMHLQMLILGLCKLPVKMKLKNTQTCLMLQLQLQLRIKGGVHIPHKHKRMNH